MVVGEAGGASAKVANECSTGGNGIKLNKRSVSLLAQPNKVKILRFNFLLNILFIDLIHTIPVNKTSP